MMWPDDTPSTTPSYGESSTPGSQPVPKWQEKVRVYSGKIDGEEEVALCRNDKCFEAKCQAVSETLKHDPTIHWVIDWDRTITCPTRKDGSRNPTAFGVIEEAPFFSDETKARFEELHDHYIAIEFDPTTPSDVKHKAMEEWNSINMKTIIDHGITRSKLRQAIESARVEIRDGFVEHAREIWLHDHQDITIYSAGITDIIQSILVNLAVKLDHVTVLGNSFEWDLQADIATKFAEPMITPDNKYSHEVAIDHARGCPDNSVVIAIGDSVGDVGMMDPFTTKVNGVTIGFYNHAFPPSNPKEEHQLEKYLNAFDVVVAKATHSWSFPATLAKRLGACYEN